MGPPIEQLRIGMGISCKPVFPTLLQHDPIRRGQILAPSGEPPDGDGYIWSVCESYQPPLFSQEKTKHPVNRHPVIFGTKFGHERGPQGSNRDAALCDESHTLGAPFGLPPGPGEGPGGAQKMENITGWGCLFCSCVGPLKRKLTYCL